jgi:hypothetical protein
VRRLEDEFAALRPEGPLTLGQVSAEQYRYFALREQVERVRGQVRELSEVVEEARLGQQVLPIYRRPDALRAHRTWKRGRLWHKGHNRFLREMAAALDIDEYLRDVVASATAAAEEHAEELQSLLGQVALLELLAASLRTPSVEQVVLWPLGLCAGGRNAADKLLGLYRTALPALRLEVTEREATGVEGFAEQFLVLHGPHAPAVSRLEAGVHLFCPTHAAVEPVQVVALPVETGAEPADVVGEWLAGRQRWLESLARGEAAAEGDPLNPGPVLRVYGERAGIVDLRTGLTGGVSLGDCLLAALPLPPDLTDENDGN